MISDKYHCIFIEVPKTGSTSIRSILGNPKKPHLNILQTKYELVSLLRLDYLYNRPDDLWNPDRPIEVAESLFQEYFKFGFVRNPWDRTVALYERREGIQLADRMSFDNFVEWIEYSSDTCIHPTRHKNQIDWFSNENGDVIVDFIGKFERLQEHWQIICKRIGIDASLPHLNKTPPRKKHYTEYYSHKTRQIIAKKFELDIEYFGYEFEN